METNVENGKDNGVQLADVNGDGLIDILHHWYTTTNSSSGPDRYFGAILLNRGDLNFELVYKCVWDALKEPGKAWYGDCAG